MTYQVQVDVRTVVILVVGLALVAVLVFSAGFLVGIEQQVAAPARPAAASPASPPASPPATPPRSGPQTPPPAGGEEESPPQAARFSIQVGAFARPDDAGVQLGQLERRGYQPYLVTVESSGEPIVYTVRIGRYATREEAAWAASVFGEQEQMEAIVVRTR